MTAAEYSSSSSSSPQTTYPISSSSSTQRSKSTPDNSTNKSLKRKRSSSPHLQQVSDYLTPSPPELYDVVVKTEVRDQQQEPGLIQKRKHEPLSPQELYHSSPRLLTLHRDTSTTLLPRPSSAFPVETSYAKPASVIERLGQASHTSKDQGTQTGLELPVSQAYLDWSGRGRSPFKTPAIAAIDGLKKGAKFIEWLEREAANERKELEKFIQLNIQKVTGLKRTRLEIEQDKMEPLRKMQVLVHPDVDDHKPRKSRSPDKYLGKMRFSTPPVYCDLFEDYREPLPEQMTKLMGLLEKDLGEGCIPIKYEDEIKDKLPLGLHNVPRSAFSTMETRSEISIEKLWEKANGMVTKTLICIKTKADENAWSTRVIQKVLEWETSGSERKCMTPTFSLEENIQSQLLAKSCRQTYQGQHFETKKTDWALEFSPEHPEVQKQYDALSSNGPTTALSQMDNSATSGLIMYAATEVKVSGGDEVEAQAQLFTWLQAGFSRLRKLLKRVGNGEPTPDLTPPLLGWTAIGARWDLYMAVGDGNHETDPIHIIGPFPASHCETKSHFGAFKLLQLMERVKDWAREEYWPWYCKAIVEPLKLVQGQPMTQEESAAEAADGAEMDELED